MSGRIARTYNGTGRPDSRPSSRTRMRGQDGDPSTSQMGASSPGLTRQHSPTSPTTTPQDMSPVSVRYVGCAHSNMVLVSLNDLRIHRELCDIELVVDDVRIPAHKSILCACSPYFKAMFSSSYSESNQGSVVIRDVSSTALELVVQYFYTSEVYITTDNVQELLSASCMFQITSLKEACCEFMRRHLGVTNCLGVRAVADLHSCAQLRKIADDFTRKNFASVIESEEFLKLEVEHLIDLFSADDLGAASEEKVYEAVMIWIQHDPVNREEFLVQLLEKVRLSLISPTYLFDHVTKESLIKGNSRAMALLMEAMEYHLLPERRAGLDQERTRPRSHGNKTQVILAVGGMGRRDPTGTPSIEQFNPVTRQWRTLTQMATGRWGAGLVSLGNGEGGGGCDEVYLVGGSSESSRLSSVLVYSVSNDQWTAMAEMSVARNGVGVVTARGLLYAVGGFDGVSPLRSAEVYDPHTNRWTSLPDMSSDRFGLGACHCDGKIYAIGGTDGTILNTAECYDVNSNTWSTVSPMSVGRKFPGAESLAGRVYIVGGNDSNNTRLRSVEMYTPSLNQWVTVAPLLQPRSGLGTVIVNGHIYAIGGHDGKGPLSSVEKYDPLTNKWFPQTPMSVSRDCVGTAKVMVSTTNGMSGLEGGSSVNGAGYAGSSSPRTSPIERDVISNSVS